MKESEVVFALAHIQPATAEEIGDFFGTDEQTSTTVTNVWRHGLAVRRKREKPGHMGPDPYEYALVDPPESADLDDEE